MFPLIDLLQTHRHVFHPDKSREEKEGKKDINATERGEIAGESGGERRWQKETPPMQPDKIVKKKKPEETHNTFQL